MWYAKPASYYTMGSTEGTGNIYEIWYILQAHNYVMECAAGVIGNVYGESGLNPWRWQGDRVNTRNGYGLYQYTPASDYLALSGVTPNMSVTQQTTGATPEDGARQTECFVDNELSKWVSTAWRNYWNTQTYSDLYAKRNQWLQQWGDGSRITMSQFSQVTDIEAATFFMLACFEGPKIPALDQRYDYALNAYEILGGTPPVPPPPPPPPPPHPSGTKAWLLKAMMNMRDHRKSAGVS